MGYHCSQTTERPQTAFLIQNRIHWYVSSVIVAYFAPHAPYFDNHDAYSYLLRLAGVAVYAVADSRQTEDCGSDFVSVALNDDLEPSLEVEIAVYLCQKPYRIHGTYFRDNHALGPQPCIAVSFRDGQFLQSLLLA